MAASVRIEDEAFADERYETLARAAGLADADHARGKMARLWRQCTIEHRYQLPADNITNVLGERGIDALVTARLGERVGDEVRIRGTKGRIEWRDKLRSNGRKGGRPKKNRGNHLVSRLETKSEPSGLGEANPPAPAPAPAQVKKTNTRARAGETPLPDGWSPNDSHQALARQLGRDLTREAADFADKALARGYKYRDWDAAFRTWLRNERFRGNGSNGQSVRPAEPIRIIPSTPKRTAWEDQ